MRTTARLAAAVALVLLVCAPAARAQSAPPPEDSQEVSRLYDTAFDALVRGDLDLAIGGFEAVASRSVDPDRRAAARELARLARAMRSRAAAAIGVSNVPAPSDTARHVTADDTDSSDRSGRTEFVIMTTVTSLYAGIVLVDLLDVDDFRGGTLVVTGATAAGFLGSFYGSRGRNITTGMADTYSAGLLLGAANSSLLASPIGLEDSEEILGFILGSTAVGGAGALWLADAVHPTRAHPSVTLTLAYTGFATVGLGLTVIEPSDIEPDTVLMLLAGGLDAGAAAGILLSPKMEWSYSRARYVGLGTFLGALGGVALGAVLVGDPEDDTDARTMAGTTLAGLWSGFGLAAYLTREMPPDPRYRTASATDTPPMVVPTMIGKSPGVGVAGTF